MRTFFVVLKNNYLRTIPRIGAITVISIIALLSIGLATYITGKEQIKGHIALISQNPEDELIGNTKELDITVLSEKPPRSALIERKYDAYVTVDDKGNYQIETLHNNDFKNMLQILLTNPGTGNVPNQNRRGVGVNIIGFMMMFLLMLSFSNLFAFADDKEQGQLHRIAAAPASFGGYLAAHCVYCLSLLLPEYILLVIMKILGANIGFSLLQYAGLMSILAFLGISVAMLLNTLIHKPDNATMLGNATMVLSSVLAGSFYSFGNNNLVLNNIIKILPQKELMNFAQYLQNGNALRHSLTIIYVIAFSAALFILSCSILRNMYIKKV